MSFPARVTDLIDRARSQWELQRSSESTHLFRIQAIRDLTRSLHVARSEIMADPSIGKSELSRTLQSIEAMENRCAKLLSNKARLNDSFESVIQKDDSAQGLTPTPFKPLPQSLFSAIPQDRFDRPDRLWEKAITSEGLALGWNLWAMEKTLSPVELADWQSQMIKALGNDGIFLFSEAAERPSAGLWHGRWYVISPPKFDGTSKGFRLVYESRAQRDHQCA